MKASQTTSLCWPMGTREFSERFGYFLKRCRKFIAKLCRPVQTFGRKQNKFEFLDLRVLTASWILKACSIFC